MKETINQRIAKCRKLANLTQTDVAERLGMKCSTYSQMERRGIVSAERLSKMAQIFNVSANYLLDGIEPMKNEKNILSNQNEVSFTLNQPEPKIPEREIFIVTKKEENLLKLIRNFSKNDYDKVIKLIESLHQNKKH